MDFRRKIFEDVGLHDGSEEVRLADVNEHQLAATHGVRGGVADQDLDGLPRRGRCGQFLSVDSSTCS